MQAQSIGNTHTWRLQFKHSKYTLPSDLPLAVGVLVPVPLPDPLPLATWLCKGSEESALDVSIAVALELDA